jgi:hypothetical protein
MSTYINEVTKEFPLFIGDVKTIDPNFNFGNKLPTGICEVIFLNEPQIGNYWEQYITRNEPELINGQWVLGWTVHDYAPGQYIEENLNNPYAQLPFGPWSWDTNSNVWHLASPLAKASE